MQKDSSQGGEERREREEKGERSKGGLRSHSRMGVKGGPCLCELGGDLEHAVWPRGSMAWPDPHGQAPAAGPCLARPEGK